MNRMGPVTKSCGTVSRINTSLRVEITALTKRPDRDDRNQSISSIYTVSGKKQPHYSIHNFENFKYSFVIFGTNHLDTSVSAY